MRRLYVVEYAIAESPWEPNPDRVFMDLELAKIARDNAAGLHPGTEYRVSVYTPEPGSRNLPARSAGGCAK